jgi:glycosyltransferase involved in cell wall biosynthesis
MRSGIAAYNAELLAEIDGDFLIDRFVDTAGPAGAGASDRLTPVPSGRRPARVAAPARVHDAHDFVWMQRREPYNLVVYQLGNSPAHDYMWAYLARYPGLVVLHDPTLHHARARQLLGAGRADDYRREFEYDHPGAPPGAAEYVVQGLGGTIQYFYSMLRVVMETARLVAVHNPRVATDLRDAFPGVAIETIRLGKPPLDTTSALRAEVRAMLGVPDECLLFAAFGKVTQAKRIGPILGAFSALVRAGVDARLLIAGDTSDYPGIDREIGAGDRIAMTGYIDDDRVGGYLAATDACLCLRWPTTGETSASWLHGLAAGRPTVITDLAHLVDIPSAVALRVDLLDEDASLLHAMRQLAGDAALRAALGRAGQEYWAAHHTTAVMAADYRRLIARAVARPIPTPPDLPSHVVEDYSGLARGILQRFEIKTDLHF